MTAPHETYVIGLG